MMEHPRHVPCQDCIKNSTHTAANNGNHDDDYKFMRGVRIHLVGIDCSCFHGAS